MLVTDAMPLVGTNDRQFMLQGRQITLHENRLTGPDGTLAGAHLTMIEAVRNAVVLLEIPACRCPHHGLSDAGGISRP